MFEDDWPTLPASANEINYDSGIKRKDFKLLVPGHCDSGMWRGYNGVTQLRRYKYIQAQLLHLYRLYGQMRDDRRLYEGNAADLHAAPYLMAGGLMPHSTEFDLSDALDTPVHASGIFEIGFSETNFVSQNLITEIRRFLDVHVQILCVRKLPHGKTDDSFTLKFDSIGQILHPKGDMEAKNTIRNLLWGTDNLSGYEHTFIYLINSLSNCMKHHFLQENAMNGYSSTEPTIVAFESKNSEDAGLIFHNHFAWQIVAGFQKTVCRLSKRYDSEN